MTFGEMGFKHIDDNDLVLLPVNQINKMSDDKIEEYISIYKGVVIYWGSDFDSTVIKVIDEILFEYNNLVAIRKSSNTVSLFWKNRIPIEYLEGKDIIFSYIFKEEHNIGIPGAIYVGDDTYYWEDMSFTIVSSNLIPTMTTESARKLRNDIIENSDKKDFLGDIDF